MHKFRISQGTAVTLSSYRGQVTYVKFLQETVYQKLIKSVEF